MKAWTGGELELIFELGCLVQVPTVKYVFNTITRMEGELQIRGKEAGEQKGDGKVQYNKKV